jgi:hypothetical protein
MLPLLDALKYDSHLVAWKAIAYPIQDLSIFYKFTTVGVKQLGD